MESVFVDLFSTNGTHLLVILDGAKSDEAVVIQVEERLNSQDRVGTTIHSAGASASAIRHKESSHVDKSLGRLESLRTVIADMNTTFMYVVHSNQPFLHPPYRYMTKNAFNRRK
jgi:hypothetical protein